MAGSTESESGWSGLLIDLVRNFLLLRDVFGYILPGLVFLLLGTLTGRFAIPDWLANLGLSRWGRLTVVLIMALVAGHVLVAISYLRLNLIQMWQHYGIKKLQKEIKKLLTEIKEMRETDADPAVLKSREKQLAEKKKKLEESPTELSGCEIEGRARFPGLFLEYDRRTTQSMMVSGLAMAFLLTALMFYWPGLHLRYVLLAAGCVMFLNMLTGRIHLTRVHVALITAIEKLEKHPIESKTPPADS
jgi:hypothetical protein